MHSFLLVFEFLGTTELLVIAVVALILFGPRKLPEIGRTVGRGIAEFKRASDDFKRTWEYEVEIEKSRPAPRERAPAARAEAAPDAAALPTYDAAALPAYDAAAGDFDGSRPQTVARGAAAEEGERVDASGSKYGYAWNVSMRRATARAPGKDDELAGRAGDADDDDDDELNAS